jgi:hypothetical protein
LFHSSLLHTFSCHISPPTILPSSLNSSCHLFLGQPLSLVVSRFICNTFFGNSISLHQHNLCKHIVRYGRYFNSCINFFIS